MLNIYLFIRLLGHWSVFYGKMSIKKLCPFFKSGCLSSVVEFSEFLNIFQILTPYHLYDFQKFPPSQEVAFLFCWWLSSLYRSFSFFLFFAVVPFVCFCSCFLCLLSQIHKNVTNTDIERAFCLCFLLRVLWFQILNSSL